MSEYVVCDSPTIKDVGHLKKALVAIGVKEENIEMNETPVPLQGYQGDNRSQKAHIIIRRKHVGSASNDIGFEIRDGGIAIYVSDYDKRRRLGKDVVPMSKGGTGRLESEYARSMIEDKMSAQGFKVSQCQMEGQKIKIRMVR